VRTSPFYDIWLFVIGSTDDHQKLGPKIALATAGG
jgi:hypothetical protein